MITHPSRVNLRRFLLAIAAAFGLTLGLFYLLLQPAASDFAFMVQLMTLTTLVSIAIAYIAYRLNWMAHAPRLGWSLMGGYALAGLLVFLNVWVIARLMFASRHDLMLGTVLLVFATGIAMSLGFFLSAALTSRIRQLEAAAQAITNGQLSARAPVYGRDEMAHLAEAFNQMAAQLQAAEQSQHELDRQRRDLTAWVSHDLRTPLTSIRAILEALADGLVDDPDSVKSYLKTAQQDVRALSRLIDDLFEISQIEAGGLRLDLHLNSITDLISDTIESFTTLAQRQNITLKGTVAPGTDPVMIDVQRIGRVLNNLVINALRHTPPDGEIEINAYRDGSQLCVEVKDNGEGIQPDHLPYIFDRFYRGEKSRSRETGGAGLGLAIARGFVEAHGGQISVHSKPGQGSVFSLIIPDQNQK